jgi:CSLREA domain-containing protein
MVHRWGEHAMHGRPRSARLLAATLLLAGAAHPPHRSAPPPSASPPSDELNADGDCSLREAISAANLDAAVDGCAAGGGDDAVSLAAGTYLLTRVGYDDAGARGDLDVTGNLPLGGAGADVTVIDGTVSSQRPRAAPGRGTHRHGVGRDAPGRGARER